ncbi:hypothetical protein KC926_01275 [Candidatus Kaiserbacteria bacterium]|nr:hypothetical protein [Candidatus Kaiserbacteria bacterium]
MEIKRVYVGGWFQRTRLHLGEIYDFLRDADSPLALDKEELVKLRDSLDIKELVLTVDRLEYVYLKSDVIEVRIYEDGLIVLTTTHSHDLQADIGSLTKYYEERLSPAFSYIFSLGAPVPKELANIKTVYPYFVTTTGATGERVGQLFDEFHQKQYLAINHEQFDVYRGDKLYVIDQHGVTDEEVMRFIEEQIFVREFRGQLHRYLNLHRNIWERIAEVNERGQMQGSEIPAFKAKIDQYKKTIDFIGTRINQMDTYLNTRKSIADGDERLKSFQDVLGYKHETLADTLEYINDIWDLTKQYVDSAAKVFSDLAAASTSNNVKNLTIVTSMGVGATLIGLFTTKSVPEFTVFGLIYFLALAVVGYGVNKGLGWWAAKKQYGIKTIELAKDL